MLDRHAPSRRIARLTPFAAMDRGLPRPVPMVAAIALGLAAFSHAGAATIVVASPGDTDPQSAATCTLRQAIASMNAGVLKGSCQNTGGAFRVADTIRFAPGIDTITLADTPHNALDVLAIDLTIDAGAGRSVTVRRSSVGAPYKFSVIKSIGPLAAPSHVTLVGLTLENGNGDGDFSKYGLVGGGVAAHQTHLVLERCTIAGNRADAGGGVYVTGNGSLTLRSSRVSQNVADVLGGGIGGAVPSILVENSTIDGNLATSGGGAIVSSRGSLALVDSTVSGNRSSTGGAIHVVNSNSTHGPLSVLNSTIACNSSTSGSAAITIADIPLRFDAFSSIFANTNQTRCTTATSREIAYAGAAPLSIGGDHNLVASAAAIDASTAFASTPVFGDPKLGPLQANGGPTPTHALLADSPAINAGSNPSNLAYDQRGAGFPRWVYRFPDIGAFEVPYTGLCGSAHGRSFASLGAGTPNLCAVGAVLQGGPFGSGPWSWFCAESAGSPDNEFCGASVLAGVALAVTDDANVPITSAIHGQPVRLRATVSGGATAPSGSVSFFEASASAYLPLCTGATLASVGGGMSASCDVPIGSLAAGSRTLKAVYGGNGTYGSVDGSGIALAVVPATSTITVASQIPNPSTIGAPFTVAAQVVANAPSQAAPSGIVTVEDQTDGLSCSYPYPATAGCSIVPVHAGDHALRVVFDGDPNVTGSSAEATQTVARAATSVLLAAPASIAFGQPATFEATVVGAIAGTPGGSVEIGDGHESCSFDPAAASGCTFTPGTYGTLPITAAYSGDATYLPGTAAASLDVVPHSVGGRVAGLLPGRSLLLHLDAGAESEDRGISADGAFAFTTVVPYGATYEASLAEVPPDQTCTIANGSGSMPGNDVTDVVVTCSDTLFADGFDP